MVSLNLSVVLSGAAGKPDTFINDSWSRSPGRSPYLSPSNPRQAASGVSQPHALPRARLSGRLCPAELPGLAAKEWACVAFLDASFLQRLLHLFVIRGRRVE